MCKSRDTMTYGLSACNFFVNPGRLPHIALLTRDPLPCISVSWVNYQYCNSDSPIYVIFINELSYILHCLARLKVAFLNTSIVSNHLFMIWADLFFIHFIYWKVINRGKLVGNRECIRKLTHLREPVRLHQAFSKNGYLPVWDNPALTMSSVLKQFSKALVLHFSSGGKPFLTK